MNQSPYPQVSTVYNSCNGNIRWVICSSEYNYEACQTWWKCNECKSYTVSNNACTLVMKYSFKWCKDGYILHGENQCINNIITIYGSDNQPRYFLGDEAWNVYYSLASNSINAQRTAITQNNCGVYGLREPTASCYETPYGTVNLNGQKQCVWYMDAEQLQWATNDCITNVWQWNQWCENNCTCAVNC